MLKNIDKEQQKMEQFYYEYSFEFFKFKLLLFKGKKNVDYCSECCIRNLIA